MKKTTVILILILSNQLVQASVGSCQSLDLNRVKQEIAQLTDATQAEKDTLLNLQENSKLGQIEKCITTQGFSISENESHFAIEKLQRNARLEIVQLQKELARISDLAAGNNLTKAEQEGYASYIDLIGKKIRAVQAHLTLEISQVVSSKVE